MRIHSVAKVVLLAPSIGSVLIAAMGLIVGVVLISERTQIASRPLTQSDGHTSGTEMQPKPAAAATPFLEAPRKNNLASGVVALARTPQPIMSSRHPRSSPLSRATSKPESMVLRFNQVVFQKPIASEQLDFLGNYAGRPANDVVREQKLRELVSEVVPYAPFHLGLDMPLPHAVESMLSSSSTPVDIREARYVMVTGMRGTNARGRAFLWIDLRQGIALGGIFFHPSNGEPTPTLTIFSRQVNQDSLMMSQLPVAFVQDLNKWAATAGVPRITTRYFINASSEKIVLAHDEDFCKMLFSSSVPDACMKMNVDAAHIDSEASNFLRQTSYASNATVRMIPGKSRNEQDDVP